jgi:fumarate reductase flavoprotein subunit
MKQVKWSREADIVVLGAGTAGLPAAVAAHGKGASVLVLEAWKSGSASSLPFISGGTPFAGTDLQKKLGIKDSPDNLCKEAVRISGGRQDLWRTIADNQLEFYDWIKSIGAEPEELFIVPGHPVKRVIHFKGGGPNLLKLLRKNTEENGIEILQGHRAEQLIQDPETRRVIGVSARSDGKKVNFRARKAVIIATGGFVQNPDLVREYGPDYVGLIPTAPPSHQGDGLKMAMETGAATEGIGLAVCPSMSMCVETKHPVTMGGWGAIYVTTQGKRWTDEGASDTGCYTAGYKKLFPIEPDGNHFVVYDQTIRDGAPPAHYKKDKEVIADSIEELEKKIGIPAGGLKSTIEEYNSDIEKCGHDRRFGRIKRSMVAAHGEPLIKIEKPPFYAIVCKVCLTSMKGGLKVNTRGQLIDQLGRVIPGVYAAGEVVGGLQGIPGHYYTGHMTINAFVYGRLVGKYAAEEPSF